jgi:hypothetical protein
MFEKERTLTAVQRTAATHARYLAVNSRSWWGFHSTTSYFPAQFGHSNSVDWELDIVLRIAILAAEEKGEAKRSD